MPTFIFFKAKTTVAKLQGANAQLLEAKIIELLGQNFSSDASGSSGSDVQQYGPHVDLSSFILKSGCECLNESNDNPLAHGLNPSKQTFLESDCDEQLIITLAFSQPIKLHSLKVKAPEEHGPKTLKIFLNQPRSLSFDQADTIDPVQAVELSKEDLTDDAKPSQLKYVKFQNVNSLTIFVKDNQGAKDTTRITQIIPIGTPVAATNMNEFKRVGGKQGEAH